VPLLRISVIAVAVVFCAATSAPRHRYPRNFPAWRVQGSAVRVSQCSETTAWVAKSGKQGVGVTVRMIGRGQQTCRAEIAKAQFEVGSVVVAAARLPDPVEVAPGSTVHVYIPFEFDNEAAWNEDRRSGALALQLAFDGRVGAELRVPVEHRRGPPHLKIDRYGQRQQAQQNPPRGRVQQRAR
jgi:hypothetical protein